MAQRAIAAGSRAAISRGSRSRFASPNTKSSLAAKRSTSVTPRSRSHADRRARSSEGRTGSRGPVHEQDGRLPAAGRRQGRRPRRIRRWPRRRARAPRRPSLPRSASRTAREAFAFPDRLVGALCRTARALRRLTLGWRRQGSSGMVTLRVMYHHGRLGARQAARRWRPARAAAALGSSEQCQGRRHEACVRHLLSSRSRAARRPVSRSLPPSRPASIARDARER